MDRGAEQEGDEGGVGAGQGVSGDATVVGEPEEEIVYGPIPVPGERVPGHTVPPVAVEAPVGETGEFAQ